MFCPRWSLLLRIGQWCQRPLNVKCCGLTHLSSFFRQIILPCRDIPKVSRWPNSCNNAATSNHLCTAGSENKLWTYLFTYIVTHSGQQKANTVMVFVCHDLLCYITCLFHVHCSWPDHNFLPLVKKQLSFKMETNKQKKSPQNTVLSYRLIYTS